MPKPGKVHLLLHAHLPFVREPSYDRFLEENWFFEAMAETYLPIIQMLNRLEEKGVPGTLNFSVSSALLAMLTDRSLLDKFSRHLHKQLELLEREKVRLQNDSEKMEVVNFYYRRQIALINTWEHDCGCEIIPSLKRLEQIGKINLLTCVGTHPFLPAYQGDVEAIHLQLKITVRAFEDAFGKKPRGLWLPECGYFEGLDAILAEYGFKYFFLETHGVLLAKPAPKYGVFAPIKTPAGLYCFGREQSSSMEVWSRKTGYPGHPEYREFFKDIAHEREDEYLGDYFLAAGTHIETGLKYYRITGSEDKKIYRPWNALRLVEDHARLFVANREETVSNLLPNMDGNKISILCPYDAELFGHWWFEGPLFIEKMFERAASSNVVEMASLEDSVPSLNVTGTVADAEVHAPIFSSWGEGGFGEVWMNDAVAFQYPLFFRMRGMMNDLKKRGSKTTKRFLAQMARELVLFQASDWAFMIHNNSAADYARARLNGHYENVRALYAEAVKAKPNLQLLKTLEQKNNLFPWIGECL
ncbi:glycoside hydrolase family 57 protein [Fibrobacter sp. UWB11]|uniref:glycoside hydrolase family 57 protein n=1 Tax=Fibrobacter sp. UWB11 TaxID=1896202 RepID=UPI00092A7C02|nr:1,4-alpha-glucan branching protein domain-containing protein [Fibrobacter sp. UWB11]SIN83903.1 1,4-alpha-glucan branching enzyme [Fibrobacter sp. UWB11]